MLLALAMAAVLAQTPAPASTRTVVLVRHAEKTDEAQDPGLTAQGKSRAAALARAVADLELDAVIVSDTKRAKETAVPAAQARGLTPIVVPTAGGPSVHVKAVADAVRALPSGSAILVVGHSNTLTPIIAALGGPEVVPLCDKEYAAMYLLEITEKGARLLRSAYGAPDPPGAGDCHL